MLTAFSFFDAAIAMEVQSAESTAESTNKTTTVFTHIAEPVSTGWDVAIDNDALPGSSNDRDYTGGVAVAFGGSRVADYLFSLNPILSGLNRLTRVDNKFPQTSSRHLMQVGLILFTPEIDGTGVPASDDRPFANLLFLENSQFSTNVAGDRAYQSTLTLGILGSAVGEAVQNAVHRLGDLSVTGGYGNQISDGGELTARYAIVRQSLLLSGFTKRGKMIDLKYSVEGDIGYLTEASVTLAARWGQAASPWWRFAPSRSNYLPQSLPMPRDRFQAPGRDNFFLWSAITVRARAYNAFLQGQFRDSEVTFSGNELNHILGEVSIGLNKGFGNTFDVSLSLHYQSNEIKNGTGSRNIRWAGLSIQRSF